MAEGDIVAIVPADMSRAAPLRCLFSKIKAPSRTCLRRNLHEKRPLSPPDFTKPVISSEKRKDANAITASDFQPYSEEEKAMLAKTYSPAQLAAIEAGEAAVDPEDLAQQGTIRDDPFALRYQTDLSEIDPLVDKPVRAPEENYDPKMRYKNEDEIAEDFANFFTDLPENASRLDYMKFLDNMRLTVGKEEAERNPPSSLAPEIPKGIPALQRGTKKPGVVEVDVGMKRLMRQTGYDLQTIRRFRVKHLVAHRVVNQTKMGKIQSMYYLTVAGNERGLLGIGEGKSAEAEDARRQAHYTAIRNLRPIPRYENRTIFGDVKAKVGAVELELMTRPPGTSFAFQIWPSANVQNRLRNPMSGLHIRDVPVRRHFRHGCAGHKVKKSHEYHQGDITGPSQSEATRRDSKGTGKKISRCTKSILWRKFIALYITTFVHNFIFASEASQRRRTFGILPLSHL